MDRLTLSIHSDNGVWFGVLVDREDRLVTSTFSTRKNPTKRLVRTAKNLTGTEPSAGTHRYARMMSQIYDGDDIDGKVIYNTALATPYQSQVYDILKQIPKSRVTTYGMIADAISSGPRAVGTAVGSNHWTLFVPCHRVVPSSFTVGNYSLDEHPSTEGTRTKEELLRKEGVRFQADKILPDSIWKPR